MEERKIKEIEYYDKTAKEDAAKESGSGVSLDPLKLDSYKLLYKLINEKCRNKKVLDYGCGTGIHIAGLAKAAKEVVGIDLSQKSLDIAKKALKKEGLGGKAELFLMDCEKMDFEDNSFDVVFDGGVFSSLDFNLAIKEISRVLRPEGCVIGVETFGHNPITNLKRKVNRILGKRTGWAAEHILKMSDLKKAKEYFSSVETHYFHIVSWIAFPVLSFPGGDFVLKSLELIDKGLVSAFPFLKKYSFKIVFVFSNPKK